MRTNNNMTDLWSAFLVLGFHSVPPNFTRGLESYMHVHSKGNIYHDKHYIPYYVVDRQSDAKYGRGNSHISADLREEDIIAYQDGTWYVDGSEVGDGSSPCVRYLKVDTIQLVWTHNCEHGVINGFDVKSPMTGAIQKGSHLVVTENYIQIRPEQVLARIPAVLMNENMATQEIWLSKAIFNPEDEIISGII